MLVAAVLFAVAAYGVSIDTECQDAYGLSAYGIVKYEWNGTVYLPDEETISPFVITLTGNADSVNWTSNFPVEGVIDKEESNIYYSPGGTSGTVTKAEKYELSNILFCGKGQFEIPEFTTLGAGLILIGAGLYARYKKRN